jgi:hypothetical protein
MSGKLLSSFWHDTTRLNHARFAAWIFRIPSNNAWCALTIESPTAGSGTEFHWPFS